MSQSLDDRESYLLKQYLAGTCTLDEFNELLAIISIQPNGSTLEELLLEEIRNSRYHEAEQQVNWQQMLQSVLQQQEVAAPAPVYTMRRFSKIAIAAAVVVCMGMIAWWWLQKSSGKQQATPSIALTTDIMSGKNGAILTLSNGQKLVLDSANNGALVTQPGLHIIKQDSMIAYGPLTDKGNAAAMAYNTLSTPKGRQFKLVMADGTKVWLNASSSIHYPAVFDGRERVVDVTGEVYFEVAKDAHKPFKVNFSSKAGSGIVEVLGTHFNINTYDDEEAVRTTLLEGKVKASVTNGGSSELKPGEQAVVKANATLTVDHAPNLDQVMAWKNGYFQFDRVDIKTVMRQISRWYDVEIVYEGPVTNDRFGGSIPREATLSQVLNALDQSLVHFTIQGKKVIVTP